MADNIDVFEVAEADTLHPVEDVQRLQEPGLLWVGKINLGEVAGNDGLGVGAQAGYEHLHLLVCGVLSFVHNDEGIGESASAHEGKRSNFDDVALQELVYFFLVKQIVEGIVQRPKIGIYL